MVFVEALEKACEDENLTREGLVDAFRSIDSSGFAGRSVENDYTILDQSPSRDSYVLGVDPEVDGGLTTLTKTPTPQKLTSQATTTSRRRSTVGR